MQTRLYLNFTTEQVSKVEFEIKFRNYHRVVDAHFLGKGRNTRSGTCYADNKLTAISYVIRNEVEKQKEPSGRAERRKSRRGDSWQAQLPLLIKFATRDRSIYGPCVFVNFSIMRSHSQKLRRQPVPSAKRKTPGNAPAFLFFSARQNAVMARNMPDQRLESPFSEIIFPQTSSEHSSSDSGIPPLEA